MSLRPPVARSSTNSTVAEAHVAVVAHHAPGVGHVDRGWVPRISSAVSRILRPPAWMRKPSMSARLEPVDGRGTERRPGRSFPAVSVGSCRAQHHAESVVLDVQAEIVLGLVTRDALLVATIRGADVLADAAAVIFVARTGARTTRRGAVAEEGGGDEVGEAVVVGADSQRLQRSTVRKRTLAPGIDWASWAARARPGGAAAASEIQRWAAASRFPGVGARADQQRVDARDCQARRGIGNDDVDVRQRKSRCCD